MAPVYKYLPKSLFFCLSFFLPSPTTRQNLNKLLWQILKLFVLFFLYSHLGLAYFICLISRCQNNKKQQVFSNLLNLFEIIFTVNMNRVKNYFSGLSWKFHLAASLRTFFVFFPLRFQSFNTYLQYLPVLNPVPRKSENV